MLFSMPPFTYVFVFFRFFDDKSEWNVKYLMFYDFIGQSRLRITLVTQNATTVQQDVN